MSLVLVLIFLLAVYVNAKIGLVIAIPVLIHNILRIYYAFKERGSNETEFYKTLILNGALVIITLIIIGKILS